MNKREEEMKDELNKKDIIIKKMNEKLFNLEKEINDKNNNNKNLNKQFEEELKRKSINEFNEKIDNMKNSIIYSIFIILILFLLKINN